MLIFLVLQAANPTTSMRWASIGVIWVFLFIMSFGWQGCVWLYCSEIPAMEYRHIGGSITAFGEWLSTFLFVMILPIGLENIRWRFWIFVLTGNIVAAIFVYLFCPETGGKTLEQIDFVFAKKGEYEGESKFEMYQDAGQNIDAKSAVQHREERV